MITSSPRVLLLSLLTLFPVAHSVSAEEALVTTSLSVTVKKATLIDGKSGIHDWKVTGEVQGGDTWTAIEPAVMQAKYRLIAILGVEYDHAEEGMSYLSRALGVDAADFTDVKTDDGIVIKTFQKNGLPAAVRPFGKTFLYIETSNQGSIAPEAALADYVRLLKAVDLEYVKK